MVLEKPKCISCNVIIITIDTLRADHLGYMGYYRETSPFLDELSKNAKVFKNHIAPISTTRSSISSLMTGLYVKNHGVEGNAYILNDSHMVLGEYLADFNYSTYSIYSKSALKDSNIDQNFTLTNITDEESILDNLKQIRKEKRFKQPFFLHIHYQAPHYPYTPPDQFRLWGEFDELNKTYLHGYGRRGNQNSVALYDGEIRYVDDSIRKMFNYFENEGLLNNSIIIITSDHGESLGKNGYYWGHGKQIYENCVHVPLMLLLPGSKQKNYTAVTSHVDLFPTILEILDHQLTINIDGLDLFGGEINEREFVYIQRKTYVGENDTFTEIDPNRNFEFGKTIAIRNKQFKYIHKTRYTDEFYDLNQDPQEKINIINDTNRTKIIGKFSEYAKNYLKDKPYPSNEDVSPETIDALMELGYLVS